MLALVLGGLAGCSSSTDDYCSAYADGQAELNRIADQDPSSAEDDQLTATMGVYQDLRAAAPEELTDEYDTLIFAYRDLVEAVAEIGAEAGVAPEDFRAGETPDGLSRSQAKALARVADKLTSVRVLEAAAGIEDYGSQVCSDDQTDRPGDSPPEGDD